MATRFIENVDPTSDQTFAASLEDLKDDSAANVTPILGDSDTGLLGYYDRVNSAARTFVNLNQAQTLTTKTLTSPTITGATLTTATLTSPVINTPTIKAATEVVVATNVITAAETGTTFFLNAATEFVSTLPAPAAGLWYEFIVTAAPSGADYTVITEGGCQVLGGHVLTSDVYTDSAVDADTETDITGTTITFVGGVSAVGDRARVISDGTGWYVSCFAARVAGITITG